ncbi:MAG: hypothetical protein WDN04_08695 [Rhodospirillales bacterium]
MSELFQILKIEQDRGSYSVDVQIRSKYLNTMRITMTAEAAGFEQVPELVREKLWEFGRELQQHCHRAPQPHV